MIRLFILASAFFMTVPSAKADFIKVGAMVGATDTSANISTSTSSTSTSSKFGLGLGAMVEFPLMPLLRLEVDALLVTQSYTALGTDTTHKYLQVPVLLRLTALPIINVGVGAFYAAGLGSISTTPSGSTVSVDRDYSVAGLKKSDFGIMASVAADWSVAPLIALFADIRYQIGLMNLVEVPGATDSSFKFNVLSLYAGVKFGF
jgi:hypothetical protein